MRVNSDMSKYRPRETFQEQLRHKKRKKKGRKILLWGFFSVICVSALIYFFFFSSYFIVQEINVDGTDLVSPDAVKQTISDTFSRKEWGVFAAGNVFFFPVDDAQNTLQKAFPPIAHVNISRRIHFVRIGSWVQKSALSVHVTERPKTALACDTAQCFFIDDDGVLFASAPFTSGASILRISETDLSGIVLPTVKYSPDFISFIRNIKTSVADEGITFDSFARINEYGDVQAHTTGNYTVFLTMSQEPKKQARILKEILLKMVQDDITKLDYVDLRVENRAYYKLKQ